MRENPCHGLAMGEVCIPCSMRAWAIRLLRSFDCGVVLPLLAGRMNEGIVMRLIPVFLLDTQNSKMDQGSCRCLCEGPIWIGGKFWKVENVSNGL